MRLFYPKNARALVGLGLPLAGSHLSQVVMWLTDTIMLGWYNIEALAAAVLGGTLGYSVYILGTGFGQAVMPMVATALANNETDQVRRITRMGLWASTLFILICLPIMIWCYPLFLALGQDDAVSILAQDYLRIAGVGLIPALMFLVLRSYLAALEITRIINWVSVIMVIGNAIVNYALIFGNWGMPELGIQGAALAWFSNSVLGLLIVVIYINRRMPGHALFKRLWRPDMGALKDIWRVGMPIGLTSLAEEGLFAASNIMVGWLGPVVLAAHGIAVTIASVMFTAYVGLCNAVTIRVGQAYGTHDKPQIQADAVTAQIMLWALALFTAAVFLLLPEPLIAFYLNDTDPDRAAVIAVGTSLLAAAAIFQLLDATQQLAHGLLRGVQDTFVPLIISLICYWIIGISASYVLGFTLGLGGFGVWLGMAVGLGAAAIMLNLRFWGQTFRRI